MREWRINIVFFLLSVLLAIVAGRLVYFQIIKTQEWRAMAFGQQKFMDLAQGERGEIYFSNMSPLVINQQADFVYAAPNEIKEKEETAKQLSLVLNLDKAEILGKITQESNYETLKNKLSDEEALKIEELKLPGVYLKTETLRYYPLESLASQVSGFLGGDDTGQYGLEAFYEDALRGQESYLEREKGPKGFLISGNIDLDSENSGGSSSLPDKGGDLVLTLDYHIQFQAENVLKKAQQDIEFESAEIIVMDPNSGKILALATWPGFDPNNYSSVKNLDIFQNSSIQKIFEPGSVFKPITMAAALDSGKITPQTTYFDPGSESIGGYVISNFNKKKWPGLLTMTNVLENSINTGAVFAQRQISHQDFLDYIEKFGFFEKTGVDLQGEVSSQNKGLKKGSDVNFATASFGQGIEITSLQLVRAFSAIANGGKLMRPYLVEKIIKKDSVQTIVPKVQKSDLISQKTASQLTAMLISVVENGYGRKTKIPGYYLAGKTGTAQVPYSSLGINQRGYSDKTIQSFIGFGPALNPQFVILVKVYNPKTSSAEESAVPLFRDMAKYIIDLWQIAPDQTQ